MNSTIFSRYALATLLEFLWIFFCNNPAFGQLNEIENSYAKYNRYNLQEKVFVHTDKTLYVCGEIVWFKAYVTNAANNQPLSLSKVLYVEVLNKKGEPLLQAKIELQSGSGNGSFFLPFSLPSGNYKLRAYTNWMKNFPAGNYFKKNISIINTSKPADSPAIHPATSYSAEFFPEGGNLVYGLTSEIAFKVNDNKNNGFNCEGVIVDQMNDTILHFKTLKFGMGHFYLNPETGKNYTAVIVFKDGAVIKKNIPKAYPAGYVIHVTDTGTADLKISVWAAIKGNMPAEIYLIIQNSGRIQIVRAQPVEDGRAVLIINKDSLQDGMSQITVFDVNKQAQCERLYFKRPKNKMVVTATADETDYQRRSKVVINVTTTSQSKNLLAGNFSASVFRLDSLHQPEHENIFSYLWLSSNLRGTVEEPEYYFNNENAEANEALDNLLLTQGWRRFNWVKVLQNSSPSFTYVPEYSHHIITGKITNEATKQPVAGALVYLSVPGRRVQLTACLSDAAGLFHFDMKDFFGSNQIVLQANTGNDSVYHLEIFNPFSEEFNDDAFSDFSITEHDGENLEAENFDMQVANGYHEMDLQKLHTPLIDTLPFYKKPTKTYLLDNYTRFTTMEEVMREYVAEVGVRRKGKNFRLLTVNEPAFELMSQSAIEQTMFNTDPLVLLDGVPVFDINKIIAYDPLKVQKLEVVAAKYYWGPITASGIVSFTTYKGNLNGYTLNSSDVVLDYDGLQQQRIFYSPDYSTDESLQSRLPDFRDVLFWSPDVNTNEKGNGSFSFYTGDIPGKYFVVLQGLSANGDSGAAGIIINVEKQKPDDLLLKFPILQRNTYQYGITLQFNTKKPCFWQGSKE